MPVINNLSLFLAAALVVAITPGPGIFYDAAIALRQAIRAALGEAWPVPLQNDLAAVLQNRGAAKVDGGDLAGAIADYDAAIALRQAIRTALGVAWPVPLQKNVLGSAAAVDWTTEDYYGQTI
jgi:hypothetical protein